MAEQPLTVVPAVHCSFFDFLVCCCLLFVCCISVGRSVVALRPSAKRRSQEKLSALLPKGIPSGQTPATSTGTNSAAITHHQRQPTGATTHTQRTDNNSDTAQRRREGGDAIIRRRVARVALLSRIRVTSKRRRARTNSDSETAGGAGIRMATTALSRPSWRASSLPHPTSASLLLLSVQPLSARRVRSRGG